jgi:hypothetical protein
MDSENSIMVMWEELKSLVRAAEVDVVKNAQGSFAAGVRARAGVRAVKAKCADLSRTMLASAKAVREEKKKLKESEEK